MIQRNKIELLAPAGNMECLVAAIKGGADAVYFAGKLFGARSFADNFSNDEIKKAVDYCHLRGVKAYITVNTLVSDREIPEAMEYLKFLNQIGVDAVIVQDLGLCTLIKENFPNLPIHGSTQMTAHNAEGVWALEKMGIEQVVLSRELSLKEIRNIKNKTKAKLEIFAHGALCMCYSGQCLLSSVIGGRSGNRGKCAQPCRLEYKINDYSEKGFYMSLKDLCSLNHINEFINIGVSSLKIEGRMKGPQYVLEVVGIYRKYIDSGEMPTKEDMERLDRIFFRGGLTDGYLTGKKGREMFCFSKPDNPYEKQSKTFEEIPSKEKKLSLLCKVLIGEGDYPVIEIEGYGIKVCHKAEIIAPKGEKRPLDCEFVRSKINKTGGTPFEFGEICVDIKGAPFMSVSEINDLRRAALEKFEKKYLKTFERKGDYIIPQILTKEREGAEFTCRVLNLSQFKAAIEYDFAKITVPDYVIYENCEEFIPYKDKIIIETAAVLKEMPNSLDKLYKMGFRNLLSENISFFETKDFNLYGGFRMNIFNSHSLNLLKEKGYKSAMLSPEMNLASIRDLSKPIKTEVMVYGHLPLMITENCVIKNRESCKCSNEVNYLIDRKGIKFPVVKDGESCRSIVLNSTPTYMGDKLSEVIKSGAEKLMLYFTIEAPEDVKRVCDVFFKGEGNIENYTRLHYHRGVL